MTNASNFTPLIQFFEERSAWLTVGAIPAMHSHGGYDVAIRIDGRYLDSMLADGVADHLAHQFGGALVAARIIPAPAHPSDVVDTLIDTTTVRCAECGRPLWAEQSRSRGVGPVCHAWRERRITDYPKEWQ